MYEFLPLVSSWQLECQRPGSSAQIILPLCVSALDFPRPLPHSPLTPCCCDQTRSWPSAQAPHSWAHSPHGPGARAAQAPEFSVPRYVFALAPVISIPACTSITSKSRSETRASQAPSVDCWVSPWLRLKCAAEKMLKVSVLNVNRFQLCGWPRGTELPSQWDHCTFLSS